MKLVITRNKRTAKFIGCVVKLTERERELAEALREAGIPSEYVDRLEEEEAE